jgi:putative membrane protein
MVVTIRVNWDALIKSFILLGYVTFLAWLLGTHDIQLYINPRFNRLTESTINILLLLLLGQLMRVIYRKEHSSDKPKVHWAVYIPFIISLLLASLLPSSPLDTKLVHMKGLNTRVLQPVSEAASLDLQQSDHIEINDQNYTNVVSELILHPQLYAGKELSMEGFVYTDSTFSLGQFALVRYVIFCCSADAMPYSILCQNNAQQIFPVGTWLKVHGTIQVDEYRQKTVPLISIDTAEPIDEPISPYIYPTQ